MSDFKQSTRDKLIEELYAVALDPDRYDHLMEKWEQHLDGIPDQSDEQAVTSKLADTSLLGENLRAHFARSHDLLGQVFGGLHEPSDNETGLIRPSPIIEINAADSSCYFNDTMEKLFDKSMDLATLHDLLDNRARQTLRLMLQNVENVQRGAFLGVLPIALSDDRVDYFAGTAQRSLQGQGIVVRLEGFVIPWHPMIEAVLEDTFDLSRSEIAIVRDLTGGRNLNEIAEKRGRSQHTVRAQLKSVFKKMELSTQIDLIRFVTLLAKAGSPTHRLAAPASYKVADKTIITMPDQRAIEVGLHGPIDGRPVIFVHGMLDGISITPRTADLLMERKIRLICPFRPSFGDSDPIQEFAEAPRQFADDLDFLLRYYSLPPLPIIGHMSGAVFSYAASHFLPEKITGIVNISGGVPIVSLSQFSKMSKRQRIMAYTARFLPSYMPTLLQAGIKQIQKPNSNAFMQALYAGRHCDAAAIEEHNLEALLYDGYNKTTTQGYRGFQSDSYHVVRNWTELVQGCAVKAIHIHGTHDGVVTIESVRQFVKKWDHAELREHDDAGQLIFYQKPDVILDAVETLLGE